jgi:AraC family transcriptional regulator
VDLLKQLNEAIAYIEENLTGDIDYREAAKKAFCSEFHFKRMFVFLSGVSISEYVRKRRLTMAALELADEKIKVIDAAVKYGYSSPDSFSRAFFQMHGITPSEARKTGYRLKAFPPMSFQLTIKGGNEMNFRLEEKGPFYIVGLKKRVRIQFNGVNGEIAEMWRSLTPDKIQELKALSDQEPGGLISASVHFSEGRMKEKGELDHYIGAATGEPGPARYESLKIESSSWAVFEAKGPFPETLQNIWGRIYAEWFPSSGYEQTEGPEILWNESKDTSSPQFKSEIWIPVIKRKTPFK